MTWWSRLRKRRRLDQDLEDELAFHRAMRARDSDPPAFGNATQIKESIRDMWTFGWLETLLADLRSALRGLRGSPGFAAAAILSLAIAIGANTAIFSVLDALLLRPLPVQNPRELVFFERTGTTKTLLYDFNFPWFSKLSEQPDVFASVAASEVATRYGSVSGTGDSEKIVVCLASARYFDTLGVRAIRGRTLTPNDNRIPGGHPVAVISHDLWERRFGLAEDIVGRTLVLSNTAFRIAGVAPPGFTGERPGTPMDIWVPFMMASQVMPEVPGGPDRFPALIFARLRPGVSLRQAEAAMQPAFQQIVWEGVPPNPSPERRQFLSSRRLRLQPGATGYSPRREELTLPLFILMTVAGVVLLIACANVANLLLARSSARQREMAIRTAIGAGRGRIVRQLLTESLVLGGIGGALALVVAAAAAPALAGLLSAGTVTTQAITLDIHPEARMLAFSAAISILTALLFGLAPALVFSRSSLVPSLATRGAGRRFGLCKTLVVTQVALTVVLLCGAGLFLRTLQNLRWQNLGFARDNVLLVWISPSQSGRSGPALAALVEPLRRQLATIPGVRAVSMTNGGVLEGGADRGGRSEDTLFEGLPPKPGLVFRSFAASPGFFAATGLPLIAGRDFTDTDTETSPPVAVISEGLAHFIYGATNPIGRRFGGRSGTQTLIVGVAQDAKSGTARDTRGVWYKPYRQSTPEVLRLPWCLAIRTTGDAASAAPLVREEIRRVDQNVPILGVTTMRQQLRDALAEDRMVMAISSMFGAIAIVIACFGLFGVISYTTARRTAEFGVRLAMGATPAGIMRMVLRESLFVVAAGLLLGIPASLACTHLVRARLFGVGYADPVTIAAAVVGMLAVGALACCLPAFRSSQVDPISVLRSD